MKVPKPATRSSELMTWATRMKQPCWLFPRQRPTARLLLGEHPPSKWNIGTTGAKWRLWPATRRRSFFSWKRMARLAGFNSGAAASSSRELSRYRAGPVPSKGRGRSLSHAILIFSGGGQTVRMGAVVQGGLGLDHVFFASTPGFESGILQGTAVRKAELPRSRTQAVHRVEMARGEDIALTAGEENNSGHR